MIYAAQILDRKFVKVGYTADLPEERIATLQTGCPYEIKLIGHTVGTLRQEQSLHDALLRAFTRIRVPHPPNEWYPGKNTLMKSALEHLLDGGFDQCWAFLTRYDQNVKQAGHGESSLHPNLKWPTR